MTHRTVVLDSGIKLKSGGPARLNDDVMMLLFVVMSTMLVETPPRAAASFAPQPKTSAYGTIALAQEYSNTCAHKSFVMMPEHFVCCLCQSEDCKCNACEMSVGILRQRSRSEFVMFKNTVKPSYCGTFSSLETVFDGQILWSRERRSVFHT